MPRENSAHQAVADAGEAGALQPLRRRRGRVRQAVEPAEQHQVLERRKLLIYRDAVAQHADAPARFRIARILAEDADPAFSCFRETGDNAQQGRLSGAVAAEQGYARARLDCQFDFAQRRIIAVVFPDVFGGDRFRHFFFPDFLTGTAGWPARYSSTKPSARMLNESASTQVSLS